jgi:uncharacterized protein YgiM (DUF1202 family)
MSKKDYTRYSKNQEKVREIQNGVETPEPVVEVEPVKLKTGMVTDCVKLNVRKEPSVNADIVCMIAGATEVEIDETQSTEEFYKIYTAAGIEGFCMKKFITIMP